MKTFGELAFRYFTTIKTTFYLPDGINVLQPFENPDTKKLTGAFFKKYYNDDIKRVFVLGINPGRFGAGLTGIAFTDPIRLEKKCGIKNMLDKRPELSSLYIYEAIHKFGGVDKFYKNFFLSSLCPVGFTSNGKNINYYDNLELLKSSRDFIISSIQKQIKFGADKEVVICLGEGKNYKYLEKLNQEMKFFKKIIPLPHPRYIMQYKRKKKDIYLDEFVKNLRNVLTTKS